jgi:hypothetical protein
VFERVMVSRTILLSERALGSSGSPILMDF